MQILVATQNQGKLREYAELLADVMVNGDPVEWVSLADLGIEADVDETGHTFEENARLKATVYAQESGMLTLADDSGLEVDTLAGAPGVMSARYGGAGMDDTGRYQMLLRQMIGIPEEHRAARFRCVVAICTPDGEIYTDIGTCEGRIGHEPRGEYGFGYDPIFVVDGYDGKTMAELPPEIKNRISHRAHALEAIKPTLVKIVAALG